MIHKKFFFGTSDNSARYYQCQYFTLSFQYHAEIAYCAYIIYSPSFKLCENDCIYPAASLQEVGMMETAAADLGC